MIITKIYSVLPGIDGICDYDGSGEIDPFDYDDEPELDIFADCEDDFPF